MLLFQAQTPRRGVWTTHGTSVLCGHRKRTVRYTSSRQASTGDICCLSIACVNSKNFSDLALLPPTGQITNDFPLDLSDKRQQVRQDHLRVHRSLSQKLIIPLCDIIDKKLAS